ncbi:mediator of RNA polymerase II transcription subunit 24 isoform X3 [Struthio camelus]
MDMFCDRLSCHGKAEECIGLCRALMSALNWLLRCAAFYAEKVKETLEQAAAESQLKMCLERLEKMLSSTKNRALIHIAKLEETSSWSAVEQSLIKLGENLSSLSNSPLRSQADDCVSLIKSIPTMLSVHTEQLNKTGFPTVHAVVLLEGTMNLTGETQPLVEQLMMVKRMQRIPSPLFVLEIWKACFVGLIESPEGTEELKWTAFTFLKIPQVLVKLKKYPQGEKDFTEDVNCAFEFLLKLTPLLDKADQRCNCDCTSLLLQECSKQGLLSEANMTNLIAKRTADREHAPRLKSAENANIQPNPGLILRAEPTVTNILKTMDADHSKSPEGLLGVLGHMLSGKSLDLLLAAAAATGKLKSFARKFIKLNEFTKHISGEGSKAASVRALLFDISFLMLCHVAQTYGSEVILSESSPAGEVPFFETWMLTCMPEEGKILNPDHPCFRPDSTKVESLVALLNNSSEMKLVQMKWHEACLSISAAILEILNAWENSVLTFESIQKITDNIKGKVCSMAVCAVAWLVAHVRMLGLDEREKSLQMIRQLATPLYGENTLQFYNERVVIMSSILEHMCADVLQQTATQIKFPSTGMDTIPYWNLLPPKKPIKEVLTSVFTKVLEKGWVDSRSIHIFDTLLHMGGVYWFCNNLVKELLKETRKEHTLRAVELLYAIFCLDMQQLTLTLLGHILPNLLTDSSKWHTLMDPPGKALAKSLDEQFALRLPASHRQHEGPAEQSASKPLPAHLFHPGGQDGWHPHPVCPVVHGGVRGLLGAGQPWQHPPVHALHHGFRAGESIHHVQSQNCPGHYGPQPAPGSPRRCEGHRCLVSTASPFGRAGEGCRAAAGKRQRLLSPPVCSSLDGGLGQGTPGKASPSPRTRPGHAQLPRAELAAAGAAFLCVWPPGIALISLPRAGHAETETNPLLFFSN